MLHFGSGCHIATIRFIERKNYWTVQVQRDYSNSVYEYNYIFCVKIIGIVLVKIDLGISKLDPFNILNWELLDVT